MHCPLGNHLLRGMGVFITNPKHIRFINKYFLDFLPSEKVCAKCKQDIKIAYEYKMKRALRLKAKNASLISSSTSNGGSIKQIEHNNRNIALRNAQKGLVDLSNTSLSSEDDDRPTTSAQAAAKRKRKENLQNNQVLPVNVRRGARLPHIQPVAKRQRFVHINPDIMDIYLRGMTGG